MKKLYGFSVQEHANGSWYNSRKLFEDAENRDAAMSPVEGQEYPRTTPFEVDCPDNG